SATALIFSLENAPTNTTDALVRVRGVAGTFYTGDQLTGFGLFLPDASFFNEVRPPPQPFSHDLRSIGKLTWYSPEGALDHRVRVRGVVTLAWLGESYFISDDAGSVRVTPENPSTVPKTGEIVDVIGFLRNPTTPDTVLVNARWKNA